MRLTATLSNLRQITHAFTRHQRRALRRGQWREAFDLPRLQVAPLCIHALHQRCEQAIHATVVELAGDGGEDGHFGVRQTEAVRMVALPLLAHIAQCVFGTALFELVQHHEVREINHVDLLELAGCAELGGHHVHRQVDHVDNLGVALTNTSSLHDDEVEARVLQQLDAVLEHSAGGHVLTARGQRAHEDIRCGERVHADAVAQQGTPRTTPRRVHGQHGNLPVREEAHQPVQQFIGQRTLACATGAGNAHHRRMTQRLPRLNAQRRHFGTFAFFQHRDGAPQRAMVGGT